MKTNHFIRALKAIISFVILIFIIRVLFVFIVDAVSISQWTKQINLSLFVEAIVLGLIFAFIIYPVRTQTIQKPNNNIESIENALFSLNYKLKESNNNYSVYVPKGLRLNCLFRGYKVIVHNTEDYVEITGVAYILKKVLKKAGESEN